MASGTTPRFWAATPALAAAVADATAAVTGQPLTDIPVPAPRAWQRRIPTDAPVLRNDLWDAARSIPRGLWSVAVYSGSYAPALVDMQDYVVHDHSHLVALGTAQADANAHWHASGYTIDQAACEWMDQFSAPAPGSALHAMAAQVRKQQQQQQQQAWAVGTGGAHVLPKPRSPWYAASVQVDDDLQSPPGRGLVSVEIENDGHQRLVLTSNQARALAAVLLSLMLAACGGGGDDPDVPTPSVNCAAGVCR